MEDKEELAVSRLTQILIHQMKSLGRSEPDVAREFGWSHQAFNSWKKGTVPRAQFHERLAKFLKVRVSDIEELVEEAKLSTGSTKIPDLGPPVMGRGTADAITLEQFAMARAKPETGGCYAVRVDGRMHWVNPKMTPATDNTVLLRSGSTGRLAKWPVEHDGEVHVIVLAEMI